MCRCLRRSLYVRSRLPTRAPRQMFGEEFFRRLGYEEKTAGVLRYWYFPARLPPEEGDFPTSPQKDPLVFFHGVGSACAFEKCVCVWGGGSPVWRVACSGRVGEAQSPFDCRALLSLFHSPIPLLGNTGLARWATFPSSASSTG